MANYKIKLKNNQTGKITEVKEDASTLFLYDSLLGRIILKLLPLKLMSKITGWFLNLKISTFLINFFIKKYNFVMEDYEKVKYNSFNDFFTRKIISEKRPISMPKKNFISPCDSTLMVYKITPTCTFKIKHANYAVEDLINDAKLAQEYNGGYVLIFRLWINNYHRYCYIDSGYQATNHYIKGEFHAVRPIVLKHYNIYKRNAREWTVLHTDNFADIIEVEVGALNVGKIVNHYQNHHFKKGEEKGYFKFGASTIVLLVKDNIIIDPKIINNSQQNIETIVKLGEQIGRKKD